MSIPSDLSNTGRRIPQQERGERRVAELLAAAADVISKNGFEAATMTEIAERAGASIGAIYQYFPNKEAVVRALRDQYADQLQARWTVQVEGSANLSVKEMVDHFVDGLVQFMEENPAYFELLDAPLTFKRDQQARKRLRERFATVFRARHPSLTPEQSYRIGNVAIQILKGMNRLYADATAKERQELVAEYKLALTSYLEVRLT